MAKKKVAAIVKIQIPAGQATPGAARRHRARPPRRGDHGLLQGVQRRRPSPSGARSSRRDHDLRGPLVHVRHQDPADAGAAPPGRRARQGLPATRARRSAGIGHRRPRSTEIAQTSCPTSTPTTSRPPSSRSPAPPARWASRSSTSRNRTARPREDLARGAATTREPREPPWRSTARSTPTRPSRYDRDHLHAPAEALDLVKSWRRPSSTRPSSWPSASASTPARPTRWSAAPSPCPSGTGKDVRVAVFAAGDAAAEARAAGADLVGADDLAAQVEGGMLDFDVAIATPDLMPHGRPARPRARPPRPDAEPQDRHGHHRRRPRPSSEFKGGKVEYRTDRYGNVHVPVGKVSFEPPSPARRTSGPCSTSSSGPSRRRPRAATSARSSRVARPWAPASRSTPPGSGPTSTDGRRSPWPAPVASSGSTTESLAEDLRCASER